LAEAFRKALGQILAEAQRQWDRDRELITAEGRAAVAEVAHKAIERFAAIGGSSNCATAPTARLAATVPMASRATPVRLARRGGLD
jgi:hypothetical protein